jgi:hypothetical protein
MCACGANAEDQRMLTAAAIAAVLAAVLVELRHRSFLHAVETDPYVSRSRRTQFLLETWAITSPSLLLLALSTSTLR